MTILKTACLAACIAASTLMMSCSKLYSAPALTTTHITTSTDKDSKESIGMATSPILMSMLQAKYSDLLDVVPQAITNLNLYTFIDDWYGVKYLWGGTTKKGIDCSAFVQKMYNNVFHTPILRTSIQQFKMIDKKEDVDSLKEGDLVFFKTKKGTIVSHVGVYLKNDYFVHSASSKGVSIASLNDNYWTKVYVGAGKVARG